MNNYAQVPNYQANNDPGKKGQHAALALPDSLHDANPYDWHLIMMEASPRYAWRDIVRMWTAFRSENRSTECLRSRAYQMRQRFILMHTFHEIAIFLPSYMGPPAVITPLFPAPHQWQGTTPAGYRQIPARAQTKQNNTRILNPNSLDEADDKDYHLFMMLQCKRRYKWPEIYQAWLTLGGDERTEGVLRSRISRMKNHFRRQRTYPETSLSSSATTKDRFHTGAIPQEIKVPVLWRWKSAMKTVCLDKTS